MSSRTVQDSPRGLIANWGSKAARHGRASLRDTLTLIGTVILPTGRAKRRRLKSFRKAHSGERCVIIGNGPSLNSTKLDLLAGEQVFGLNRFYLMQQRSGVDPTYHVVVNKLVVEQCRDELLALTVPLFTTVDNKHLLGDAPHVYYLPNRSTRTRFSRDIRRGIWEGSTVTYVAMQIAFYMGYRQVVLVGVDHRFTTKGEPHKTVVSEGSDPNHFDPQYFGRGFRWQLPDLDASETSYRCAKSAYERAGKSIVDCTAGGALDVFEKHTLESVIG